MSKTIKGTSPNGSRNSTAKQKDGCKYPELSPSQLSDNYRTAVNAYVDLHRRMVLLNGVDNGRLWKTINAKFPSYQILPDTNWVSYIKSNIVASVYCVGKAATILPTSDDDREAISNVNIALDYIWHTSDIGYKQMQAGNSAALYNLGVTQVGWNREASKQTTQGAKAKGDIVIKNISPLRYMRDPYADSLENANYVITWEDYHKSVIMANPLYKEKFAEFLKRQSVQVETNPANFNNERANPEVRKDYYKIIIHFVKYIDHTDKGDVVKIAEIHTIANTTILYENDDVLPRMFPFAELYCNLPETDPVGVSEPAKILSNNIAYNLLSSMLMTSEYKNQRPPKFISSTSGLNIRNFSKYGNEADHTFIVNGDASRAVHYHQFPQPSVQALNMQNVLIRDVQTTSGVDGRYTGRDTGSILTTGGVEDMLSRVTLIDAPKIANYEAYSKHLTKLILANFREYGTTRTYYRKLPNENKYETLTVDYKALQNPALLDYEVNISSELPKTKQRVAAMANMLMEKQMQYGASSGMSVDVITPKEWLMLQDLPNKEFMMKRMDMQTQRDYATEIAETLLNFTNLVKQNVSPDDAISIMAENKAARSTGSAEPYPMPQLSIDDLMAQPAAVQPTDAIAAAPTQMSMMDDVQLASVLGLNNT